MEELQKKFTIEFENVANKILKTHSQEFTQTNVKNIGEILNPLKDKIVDFEKKVNEAYDKELRDKISLREEVKKLYELNSRISEEANNLTKALKGDSKKQGNWGEIVLEKILERSGLTKGQEYEVQYSIESEEGKRFQPDVVIKLPDNKHIIVDSKVSLVAYEKFVNSNDDDERQQFMKE
jgi:DNA recombination protein RmuC